VSGVTSGENVDVIILRQVHRLRHVTDLRIRKSGKKRKIVRRLNVVEVHLPVEALHAGNIILS